MRPYFKLSIPSFYPSSVTPFQTIFGASFFLLPKEHSLSSFKNVKSHLQLRISEQAGTGTIKIMKKGSFEWSGFKFGGIQNFDLSRACFLESSVIVSTSWREFKGFATLSFMNMKRFTGFGYGLEYNPLTHLRFFALSDMDFEADPCPIYVGFELKNSNTLGVTASYDFAGGVHLRSRWQLTPHAALECRSSVRLRSDDNPIDLGVKLAFDY